LQRDKESEELKNQIVFEDKKMRVRQDEFDNRMKKIQEKMDLMSNTVVWNENEKRLKEEKRLLQIQHDKDIQDMIVERERKQRTLNQNIHTNQ